MDEKTRKSFLFWSKTEEYNNKLKKTQNILRKIVDTGKVYVSFSGGKDSTVITHLALQLNPNIPVWHWDYGDKLIPRPIEKEVISNLYKLGAKNILIDKRRGDDARNNHNDGYKQFFGQITKNKQKYGWTHGIIGVRREESTRRKNKYTSYVTEDGVYPILDWSFQDVWAYIVSNGLPYPEVYDYYSKVLGWDRSRFVTFFDGEFEQLSYIDGVILPEYRDTFHF